MDEKDYVRCIVEGMQLYFRAFGLADNMHYQPGDIEWIAPRPDSKGVSIVFKVSLDEATAAQRIGEIIAGIKAGAIPSFWVVSPVSTPKNILDLLLSAGFKDTSNPEHPEPGMSLDMERLPASLKLNPNMKVTRVQSSDEFAVWIDVVNEALHGWNLLTAEHYGAWLSCTPLTFYLAYLDGTPAATVATFRDGDRASVEFVSTKKAYRRQGAATAVCLEALRALQKQGVKTVTLRSSTEAISLYTRLGFKSYFDLTLLSYSR